MLTRARDGLIRGLIPNLVNGGLIHLHYADDTVLFLDLDNQTIDHVKYLIYYFEDMSG
jgi:hypothetical protein